MRLAFPLLATALLLSCCDWFEKKHEEARRTDTVQQTTQPAAAGKPAKSVSSPDQKTARTAQAAPALPERVALDFDGDGAADSVRAAPVGEYAVSAPIAFRDGSGAVTEPTVDWKQTALVVRLSSAGEQAINFPYVKSMVAVSASNAEQVKDTGCVVPANGQALLATGEEGAMMIRFQDGRLIATACGS